MTKKPGQRRGKRADSECFHSAKCPVDICQHGPGRSEDFWGDKRPVDVCLSRPEWNEDHEVRRNPCVIGVRYLLAPTFYYVNGKEGLI